MSLDWKLQRSSGNRPHNPMLFLAISLLLHGAVLLGIATYRPKIVNQPLRTEPKAPIPVRFIEVPADKLAVTPPKDAKIRASNNSIAGGKARPELPIATGAFKARPTTPLPSRQPSLTQSKSSSTPRLSQHALSPEQSQPVVRRVPLPPEQPRPVVRRAPLPPEQPRPVVRRAPLPPEQPQPVVRRTPLPSQQPRPVVRRDQTLPTLKYSLRQSPPHLPTANRQAYNDNPSSNPFITGTLPARHYRTRQSQGQNASLLGGPVRLASRDFMGASRDDLPNANRSATGFNGVDARQDIDLSPYLDKLRRQVKQQWHPDAFHSSAQTVLGFSVSRDGQLSALRILQSSGSTLTDQAALAAVQRAAPFGPLPEGYRASQLNILFRFNISVYGQLEPQS